MPFTEYVMAAGSWSLDLDPGTPQAVRRAIDVADAGFSQLIITPVHVDPASFGDAGIIAAARYAGIYRSQSRSGLTLSGAGMNILMGDEDEKGPMPESYLDTGDGTLSHWFTEMTEGTDGVLPGTLYTVSGSIGYLFRYETYRQNWESICDYFGVEYRLNPDATLDVGEPDDLYGSTPRVIVLGDSSPRGAGRDIDLTGVRGSIDQSKDLEDYVARIIYPIENEDGTTRYSAAGSVSDTYRHPAGQFITMKSLRDIVPPNDDTTFAATATAELNRLKNPRLEWNVSVQEGTDVGATSPVGSRIWLHDPATGQVDDANTVIFGGAQLDPKQSRLMGLETPIMPRFGVYMRTMADATTPVYTDLTPYVVPESGQQRLTVGALPRLSRKQRWRRQRA